MLVLMILCCPGAGAVEIAPTAIPRDGLLVLTNGSLIEGVIALEGDYYKIVLPKGKLRVRVDQVEFFCESKEEAYIRRRSRKITTTTNADAHLEMARWCIQHELLSYANAEIEAARALDPEHRLLAGVARQLSQAEIHQARAQPTDPVVRDEKVETVAAEVDPGARFGEIPVWARTEFIKRIQPMMVQSCATSGCHLPDGAQVMQINRTALDGVGSPDLIRSNLTSIVAMLDLEDPETSRLLVMGAAAHGTEGKQSRALTPHQLGILRAWITQLALNEMPQEEVEETPVTEIVVGMGNGSQQKYTVSAPSAATTPDPFDPAEFNSSHGGDSEPAAATVDAPAESQPSEPSQ